jgi:hypothetical protein
MRFDPIYAPCLTICARRGRLSWLRPVGDALIPSGPYFIVRLLPLVGELRGVMGCRSAPVSAARSGAAGRGGVPAEPDVRGRRTRDHPLALWTTQRCPSNRNFRSPAVEGPVEYDAVLQRDFPISLNTLKPLEGNYASPLPDLQ